MKRWIILAVLVVAITTTATIAVQYLPMDSSATPEVPFPTANANSGPKPLAVVEGDLTHHFGMAAQQVKIKQDWVIKNEGKADLELTKGFFACTCTSAEFKGEKDSMTLKPGQDTTLHLTFETRDSNGVYHKTANILTNDPLHPSLEFAVDGTVRPSVVLYPPEPTINYLEITNDQDDHRTAVVLYSPDRPDIKITQLVSSRPKQIVVGQEPLSAEDCKTFKIERGLRINIDVTGEMPLGVFREEVVIKTDHPKQPELRLTVTGKMVGPISTSPDRVRMVGVYSRVGMTGQLKLTVRGRRPTKFEVEHKPENLKVDVTPGEHPGQYVLNVTVPPGTPSGMIMDQVVLKTDHPKAGEVKVSVDVQIQND